MKFNKSYSRSICDFIDIEEKIDKIIAHFNQITENSIKEPKIIKSNEIIIADSYFIDIIKKIDETIANFNRINARHIQLQKSLKNFRTIFNEQKLKINQIPDKISDNTNQIIKILNDQKNKIQTIKEEFKENYSISAKNPMTPEFREMVDLYYAENYSAEEIAEILNMRKNTVKKYIESPEIKKQYLRKFS